MILIASGSKGGLIVAAERILQERQIPVRLISMPSWESFEAQSQAYRDAVCERALALLEREHPDSRSNR